MGKSHPLKLFSRKNRSRRRGESERNSTPPNDSRSRVQFTNLDNIEEGTDDDNDDDADFDWDALPSPTTSDGHSLDNSSRNGDSRALPSFKRRRDQRSNEDIERDAVNTIRDTGGAYEEPDSGSEEEDAEMMDQYQRERDRLGNASDSTSASSSWRGSKEGKNVRFDTGSNESQIESIDRDEENTDTKGNDEEEPSQRRRKNSINVEDQEGSETSSSNNETKLDHFRQFFRRGSMANEPHENETDKEKNTQDNGENDEQGGGFLSRVIQNIKDVNNGLTPGLINSYPPAQGDIERDGNQEGETNGNSDVQPVDFKSVAQGIVRNYSRLPDSLRVPSHPKTPGILEGDTMYSPSTPSTSRAGDADSLVAPPMDDYDFDQFNSDSEDSDLDPFVGAQTYVPPPERVRGGVLGSLLKMYQDEDRLDLYSTTSSEDAARPPSPSRPPLSPNPSKHKIHQLPAAAAGSLLSVPSSAANHLKKNAQNLAGGAQSFASKHYPLKSGEKPSGSHPEMPSFKNTRPKKKHKKHHLPRFKKKLTAQARITVHIADLLQRHRFILRLCKGLMLYGAPTHRLEEYLIMTARVLEVDGQFLYLPGCMIVSFGDATTRTSEVQLVKCAQGVNLWKLHQVHSVYKMVVHDTMSAAEGNVYLDKILQDRNLIPSWVCVLLYGFCSAMVTPYAFGGDWVNLAVSFVIGTCVGTLQYIVSARSNMYSNVFEISASIVVSFVGRAFGSIGHSRICFGAVTQGSLALILPGYIILCGALELQSRNLVAGSVRMFYAIIYSLFLSFGITLGAALFGWMYKNATNETDCSYPISPWYRFIFVPMFTIGISLINQAHWIQLPVMTVISCAGYVITYFSGKHFKNSTEFTAALASFIIGVMGNLYSRIWKGLAVSAMLPAIFVQVPSGVASQSSLLSGLQNANELIRSGNHTQTVSAPDRTGSLSFGMTMIQVSIGITVGLFASSLIVYPFGKKSTALFSL